MNGCQRTAVSRKELWQKQKQMNCSTAQAAAAATDKHEVADNVTEARTDIYQIFFQPGWDQPLRDKKMYMFVPVVVPVVG